MTTVEIPLTTYQIKSARPNQPYGSPDSLKVANNVAKVLARVPLDKIPADATITLALVRFFADRDSAGSKNLRALQVTQDWKSSVVWANPPATSTVLDSVNMVDPVRGTPFDLNITPWATTRNRKGLMIESTTAAPGHFIRGSAGANLEPVLVVTYTVKPDPPGNLVPDGGSVSVAAPILTYVGDEDMTHQLIEFSNDGITTSLSTGWVAATEGRFDPAAVKVLVNNGAGTYWRASTRGPNGDSDPSGWAWYDYKSLAVVAWTAPVADPTDGSPPAQWTVTGRNQASWQAWFKSGSTLVTESKPQAEPATRDWTPNKSIAVPGAPGRYILEVTDDIVPRVAAENAPVVARPAPRDFVTTLTGAATAINSLQASLDDPIPVLVGTRAAGIPDEVALVRDGKFVPLWSPLDGEVYTQWAPGADFFAGTNFTLLDYTANLRHEHTWAVRTRTGGVAAGVSSEGPTATEKFHTPGAWLVNPVTGDRVEVLGVNGQPAIEQTTDEQSIVHVPMNGGPVVEPKRRRLLRTTKSGKISGVVLEEHEALLDEWVAGDSRTRYRLIFGKVNWTVIIGDYSPTDVFYPTGSGPDRVLVELNWWQRLGIT